MSHFNSEDPGERLSRERLAPWFTHFEEKIVFMERTKKLISVLENKLSNQQPVAIIFAIDTQGVMVK